MRFTDFLKATVMTSAAAATVLALLTVIAAAPGEHLLLMPFAAGWWVLAGIIGSALGRRAATTPPIARLLADARSTRSLPATRPGRVLLNRLWPLLACTLGAGALVLIFPQVTAIAAGFAVIWALSWRRQDAAVTAIEGRDGVQYFVEPTSPLKAIRLLRAPGLRSNLWTSEETARAAPGGASDR